MVAGGLALKEMSGFILIAMISLYFQN